MPPSTMLPALLTLLALVAVRGNAAPRAYPAPPHQNNVNVVDFARRDLPLIEVLRVQRVRHTRSHHWHRWVAASSS